MNPSGGGDSASDKGPHFSIRRWDVEIMTLHLQSSSNEVSNAFRIEVLKSDDVGRVSHRELLPPMP